MRQSIKNVFLRGGKQKCLTFSLFVQQIMTEAPPLNNYFRIGMANGKPGQLEPCHLQKLRLQALTDWADLILVMESIHVGYVDAKFKCDSAKVRVLGIKDIYVKDDPNLVRELERKVTPILRSYSR